MNGDNERMGEVLERIGLITADDLAAGLLAQVSSGGRLGDVLVRSRVVTEDQIAEALAEQKDLKHIFLTSAVIDSDAANLLPATVPAAQVDHPGRLRGRSAGSRDVGPTRRRGHRRDRDDHRLPCYSRRGDRQPDHPRDREERHRNSRASPARGRLRAPRPARRSPRPSRATERDVPVVRIVNQILRDAVREGASDVHFEPDDVGRASAAARRRCAARGGVTAKGLAGRPGEPHQDHGRDGHLGASAAAGRTHRVQHPGRHRRPAGGHDSDASGRGRRHPNPVSRHRRQLDGRSGHVRP